MHVPMLTALRPAPLVGPVDLGEGGFQEIEQ